MKKSLNILVISAVLWGGILLNIAPLCGINLPPLILTTIYYLVLAFAFRKVQFVSFLLLSFTFISFYFCFISFIQINPSLLWQTWQSDTWAIKLYISLLLPLTFLSFTINFFALPYELVSLQGKIFLFVIPILLKRELILKRFEKILEALNARGLETKTTWQKYRLMPLWIVPLVTTTILEGIESYQYNEMLHTNIASFQPRQNPYALAWWQKTLLVASVSFLILTYLLKWKYS